jgi:hypothetical protein
VGDSHLSEGVDCLRDFADDCNGLILRGSFLSDVFVQIATVKLVDYEKVVAAQEKLFDLNDIFIGDRTNMIDSFFEKVQILFTGIH